MFKSCDVHICICACSTLCTSLLPAWPSYWCLCCGGHLERCPAAAHEHCPYPSSPYSSVWQGCQPHLQSLPGSAMVSNCQCLYTFSARRDTVFWWIFSWYDFFLKMITSQLNINKNYISQCKLWSIISSVMALFMQMHWWLWWAFWLKRLVLWKQKEFVSQSGFGLLPQEMAPPKFDSEPNFQALASVQTENVHIWMTKQICLSEGLFVLSPLKFLRS